MMIGENDMKPNKQAIKELETEKSELGEKIERLKKFYSEMADEYYAVGWVTRISNEQYKLLGTQLHSMEDYEYYLNERIKDLKFQENSLKNVRSRRIKKVELIMGLSEIKQEYPIGSAYEDKDGMYKVVGYFEPLPAVSFASFPGIKVTEADEWKQ